MPDIANRLDLKYTYPKAMKRETIKFILLIFFAAAAFSAIKYLSLDKRFFSGDVARWVEGFGPWAPLIYISLYAIAPSFMFPGSSLDYFGRSAFRPFMGHGLRLSRRDARRLSGVPRCAAHGQAVGRKKIKNTRLQKLDEDVERYGWKIVAFTRLIPLFPFNVLNYAFGMTKDTFFALRRGVLRIHVAGSGGLRSFLKLAQRRLRRQVFVEFLGRPLSYRYSLSIPLVYKRLPLFQRGGVPIRRMGRGD